MESLLLASGEKDVSSHCARRKIVSRGLKKCVLKLRSECCSHLNTTKELRRVRFLTTVVWMVPRQNLPHLLKAWERAKVSLQSVDDECRVHLGELSQEPLEVDLASMDEGRRLKNTEEEVRGKGIGVPAGVDGWGCLPHRFRRSRLAIDSRVQNVRCLFI